MTEPTRQIVDTATIPLFAAEMGDGPPVILLHGFPESWYSWRHQLPALAAAGLRAIAPNQRGYGPSAIPEDVEEYRLVRLVDDVFALADALELDTFSLVGHDWGSLVAFTAVVRDASRIDRLATLNVPYTGWSPGFPTTDVMASMGKRFSYVLSFQNPGEAEARFEADPDDWFRRAVDGVAGSQGFLSDHDFAVYRDLFVEHGLRGPLNWYRNIDRNAIELGHTAGTPIDIPTLMVTVGKDPVLPPRISEPMDSLVPDLTRAHIEDCGHWTQQEHPEEVNRLLIEFLT